MNIIYNNIVIYPKNTKVKESTRKLNKSKKNKKNGLFGFTKIFKY